MQVDAGKCSVLILLDLTAAFDTADHCILVERLRKGVGMSGYLEVVLVILIRQGFFRVQNYVLSTASVSCGVPQGYVLAPLPFALYKISCL